MAVKKKSFTAIYISFSRITSLLILFSVIKTKKYFHVALTFQGRIHETSLGEQEKALGSTTTV